MLIDNSEFTGTGTSPPTSECCRQPDHQRDNHERQNLFIYDRQQSPGGSVTSSLASVTVTIPPPHSFVSYTNQLYLQTFDALPDPGGNFGQQHKQSEEILAPSAVWPIRWPIHLTSLTQDHRLSSYVGGLALSTGAANMNGWYGAADTNTQPIMQGTRTAITRFSVPKMAINPPAVSSASVLTMSTAVFWRPTAGWDCYPPAPRVQPPSG